MAVQNDIPNFVEIVFPDGTYPATLTDIQVDKAGQWFGTSMSGYAIPGGKFGTHLWYKKKMTDAWTLLEVVPGGHGKINCIGQELFYIYNRENGSTAMRKILRWQGVRS